MAIKIQQQVPISRLTTFGGQGCVARLVTVETLAEAQEFLAENQAPLFFLGRGSNVLIKPETPTIFLRLKPVAPWWEITGQTVLVQAGCPAPSLLAAATKNGLSGLEMTAGISAAVGGLIAMNFGCWGQEIGAFVQRVQVVDRAGQAFWLERDALAFGYRTSVFSQTDWLIWAAILQLPTAKPAQIRATSQTNIQKRRLSQPLAAKTFGSIFKNPPGFFAGKILSELGFKGYVYKSVKISDQHANFMVNPGQATYNDAVGLMELMQEKCLAATGLSLEAEVKIIT